MSINGSKNKINNTRPSLLLIPMVFSATKDTPEVTSLLLPKNTLIELSDIAKFTKENYITFVEVMSEVK